MSKKKTKTNISVYMAPPAASMIVENVAKKLLGDLSTGIVNQPGYNYLKKKIFDKGITLLIRGTKEYKRQLIDPFKKLPTFIRKIYAPRDSYSATSRAIITNSKPGENIHILAHEFGHSVMHDKFPSLKFMRVHGNQLASIAGVIAASNLTNDYIKTHKAKTPLDNPYITLPAIAATAQLPQLIDEYRASKIGIKTLKDSKVVSPKELQIARKELAKAFSTYGVRATMLTLAPIIALRTKQYFYNKKNKKVK